MVRFNDAFYQERLRAKAQLWGISIERAEFLAKCAYDDKARAGSPARGPGIPYDPAVQVKEAARLGIGLSDTALMMGLPVDEVAKYGHKHPEKSSRRLPQGNLVHNLLIYD